MKLTDLTTQNEQDSRKSAINKALELVRQQYSAPKRPNITDEERARRAEASQRVNQLESTMKAIDKAAGAFAEDQYDQYMEHIKTIVPHNELSQYMEYVKSAFKMRNSTQQAKEFAAFQRRRSAPPAAVQPRRGGVYTGD